MVGSVIQLPKFSKDLHDEALPEDELDRIKFSSKSGTNSVANFNPKSKLGSKSKWDRAIPLPNASISKYSFTTCFNTAVEGRNNVTRHQKYVFKKHIFDDELLN